MLTLSYNYSKTMFFSVLQCELLYGQVPPQHEVIILHQPRAPPPAPSLHHQDYQADQPLRGQNIPLLVSLVLHPRRSIINTRLLHFLDLLVLHPLKQQRQDHHLLLPLLPLAPPLLLVLPLSGPWLHCLLLQVPDTHIVCSFELNPCILIS
jgi:hypothetical protein